MTSSGWGGSVASVPISLPARTPSIGKTLVSEPPRCEVKREGFMAWYAENFWLIDGLHWIERANAWYGIVRCQYLASNDS
jgi:hypothetical protein